MVLQEKQRGAWIVGGLFVIGFVPIWYALIQAVSHFAWHVTVTAAAIPGDLLAHLLLAVFCYGLSGGRLSLALPAIAALMAAINLCNAGKIAFYGTPVMPDDFLALRNLFMLLTGWQLAGAITIVLLPTTLVLLMISWRQWRTWLFLVLMILAIMIALRQAEPIVKGLDAVFKNSVWDQRGNFANRGVLIHLVQESLRHQTRRSRPPSADEVGKALEVLRSGQRSQSAISPQGPGKLPRNVHMILLESFWDAALLTGSGLSEDPLDPAFRRLWQSAGNSHALSPVFGGYTANPEFEVLCGMPVTEDHVVFEAGLRNSVACLPQVLHAAGYRSIASHPNVAGFWNRVNAYRRLGFDTYWSDRDFVLDDLNGEFLSDASLYRQVMAKVTPITAARQPIFNYVLTYFGHVDYPLNAERPKKITTTDKNALLNAYVNLLYYKSRELMVFLEKLQKDDPDSLIVLFGDHLPFLGPGFYGFLRSKLLTDNRATMTDAMVYTLTATPLVVIDGRRGPLVLGDVPMYRLPALILDLLGMDTGPVLRLSVPPGNAVIRPLPGMYLTAGNGQQTVCREDQGKIESCKETDRWLRAITTVRRDLFSGKQYSLPEIEKTGKGKR